MEETILPPPVSPSAVPLEPAANEASESTSETDDRLTWGRVGRFLLGRSSSSSGLIQTCRTGLLCIGYAGVFAGGVVLVDQIMANSRLNDQIFAQTIPPAWEDGHASETDKKRTKSPILGWDLAKSFYYRDWENMGVQCRSIYADTIDPNTPMDRLAEPKKPIERLCPPPSSEARRDRRPS